MAAYHNGGEKTGVAAILNPKMNYNNIGQTFNEPSNNQPEQDKQSVKSISGRQKSMIGQNTRYGKLSESLKTCLRIWSGYTKYIRSQCNKGRIIDSLHLGTFYRDGSNDYSLSDPTRKYVFVLGGKGNPLLNEFKVRTNAENIMEIPEDLAMNRDHLSCNMASIA